MLQPPLRILHLYVSPGHNFFGNHGKPPGDNPTVEVPEVRCIPGQGIEGDRFFDFKSDYKGQITFFSQEVFERLREELKVRDRTPAVFRRNVVCAGMDLNALAGVGNFAWGLVLLRGKQARPEPAAGSVLEVLSGMLQAFQAPITTSVLPQVSALCQTG